MRYSILSFLAFFFLFSCNNNSSNPEKATKDSAEVRFPEILTHADSLDQGLLKEVDTIKGSPYQTVSETKGKTKIEIGYSSPGVKDRIIWGGLVPYDKVWVTGAHLATWIQFSKKVKIDGKEIPAGKYAFFTIPGEEKWIAILNKRFDQHLADEYNDKEDILRIELHPDKTHFTERLTYTFESTFDDEVSIVMRWDRLEISLPVTMLE